MSASRTYALELDPPPTNVFVTQLNEREDDTRQHGGGVHPVVTDKPGKLLETGINTLQKTLLLKKEVEVEKVDLELQAKRNEFRERMERCAERQLQLQKDQQAMKDRVTKFEKFINENEGKRRRAIQKYQTEIRLKEYKQEELTAFQQEHERLLASHRKLKRKLKSYRIFETYLLKVLDILPENYIEMGESHLASLMMRHGTLDATHESLVSDLEGKANELERLRSDHEEMRQEHDKLVVSLSSELANRQKEQDKAIDNNKQQVANYLLKKEEFRGHTTEYGQILMGISNIFVKCRSGRSGTSEMPLDEKLNAIRDYVNDRTDVYGMALNFDGTAATSISGGKYSAPASGKRIQATKVRFQEG